MKAFFRSAPVQTALALILGGYLWLVLRTIRWTVINREPADAILRNPDGFLVCFWHGRIAASIGAQPLCRRCGRVSDRGSCATSRGRRAGPSSPWPAR